MEIVVERDDPSKSQLELESSSSSRGREHGQADGRTVNTTNKVDPALVIASSLFSPASSMLHDDRSPRNTTTMSNTSPSLPSFPPPSSHDTVSVPVSGPVQSGATIDSSPLSPSGSPPTRIRAASTSASSQRAEISRRSSSPQGRRTAELIDRSNSASALQVEHHLSSMNNASTSSLDKTKKISFGNLLNVNAAAASSSSSSNDDLLKPVSTPSSSPSIPNTESTSPPLTSSTSTANKTMRKSSGPKALLRKARSFTTSPVLASSSTFGAEGTKTATTTTANDPKLVPKSTTSFDLSTAMNEKGKQRAVELDRPTPHWLFGSLSGAAVNSTPTNGTLSNPNPSTSSLNGKKNVNVEPRATASSETIDASRKKASVKSRRSTFSLFKRNTSSTLDSSSQATTPTTPTTPLFDSPVPSPTTATGENNYALLTIPALQLAGASYRMSWSFAPNSTTPDKLPEPNSSSSSSVAPKGQRSPTTTRFSGIPSTLSTSPKRVSRPTLPTVPSVSINAPTPLITSSGTPHMPLLTSSASSSSISSPSTPQSVSLRRNLSWTGVNPTATTPTVSSRSRADSTFSSEDAGLANTWMMRNGINTPPPSVGSTNGVARRILTRASRSYSDGSQRPLSFGGAGFVKSGLGVVTSGSADERVGSNEVTGSEKEVEARGTAPAPPTVMHYNQQRRPKTSASISSDRERSSVFGAVSNFFSNSLSSSSTTNLGGVSMSRSSSQNSTNRNSMHDTTPIMNAETSEFGALFGGSSSSSPATSPTKSRIRGLSVGNSLFGSNGRKRAGSASSLSNSWIPPTSGGLLAPGDATTSGIAGSPLATPTGRSRASTDPKRLSEGYFPTVSAVSITPSPALGNQQQPLSTPSSPAMTRRSSFAFSRPSTSGTPPASRKGSFSYTGTPSTSTTSISMSRGRSSSALAPVPPTPVPKLEPEEAETPSAFVDRIIAFLKRSEVTRCLSQSGDAFSTQALAAFMNRFDFTSDALDIALRKFLMEASLPVETQQIDRVMESFAKRYMQCNEGLFESSDTPYVLAFSLVMLGTDQFNPSNKSKMSKADYVKNTRIDGVGVEVLEYFFDQISIAPFVFVEDGVDLTNSASPPELTPTTSSFFTSAARSRLDPYHSIATGMIRDLRIDVESTIPTKSPFSFTGTTSFFNATTLHRLFAQAPVLQIRPSPSTINGRARAKSVDALAGSPLEPTQSNMTFVTPSNTNASLLAVREKEKGEVPVVTSVKVVKIGTLSRKEDLVEGGKKAASRKWKAWSVVLTSSQILFFKDPLLASSLESHLRQAASTSPPPTDESQVFVCPYAGAFKPDAVLSLANSAAIYDSSYVKYSNVFRLVGEAGRQYLFRASSSENLNSWLHAINYAAAFKSAGLRIRPLALPISAANSPKSATPRPVTAIPGQDRVSSPRFEDSEDAKTPRPKSAKGEEVKSFMSELANELEGKPLIRKPSLSSRAEQLRLKIADLETEVEQVKNALQVDLRLVRNLKVLTPFKSSTRERVYMTLPAIDKRVRHARMNLAKLVCHREVLSRDWLVEDRSHHSRHPSFHRQRVSDQHRSTEQQRTPRSSQQHSYQEVSSQTKAISPLPTPRAPFASRGNESSFDNSGNEDIFAGEAQVSWTDDELDRLRAPAVRIPRLQRSTTDSSWSTTKPQLVDDQDLGATNTTVGSELDIAGAELNGGLATPLLRDQPFSDSLDPGRSRRKSSSATKYSTDGSASSLDLRLSSTGIGFESAAASSPVTPPSEEALTGETLSPGGKANDP